MFATLLTISILIGLSSSSPLANYWLSPVGSLAQLNQYHDQDGSGSYRYGYTGPHHAKMETRSNGVTQGGYSYVDANGILQTVAYSADDENGFRVHASNLPQPPQPETFSPSVNEIPEVAATGNKNLDVIENAKNNLNEQTGRKNFLENPKNFQSPSMVFPNDNGQRYQPQRDTITKNLRNVDVRRTNELKNPFLLSGAEAARIEIPKPDYGLFKNLENAGGASKNIGSRSTYENVENSRVVPLPEVRRTLAAPATSYVVPVVPYRLLHSSLHHTQDSLGQYDYSYVGDTSSKTESRSLDGTTRGAYSYVDANGLLQQVHYIADHNGFRVIATNLPEA